MFVRDIKKCRLQGSSLGSVQSLSRNDRDYSSSEVGVEGLWACASVETSSTEMGESLMLTISSKICNRKSRWTYCASRGHRQTS